MDEIENKAELTLRRDELQALENRKAVLINELNSIAQKIQYGVDDYDSEEYWGRTMRDIAYAGGVMCDGHRLNSPYTFWLPSNSIC